MSPAQVSLSDSSLQLPLAQTKVTCFLSTPNCKHGTRAIANVLQCYEKGALLVHDCTLPDTRAFPLAAVLEHDRFSIVTTKPNASVASMHGRMSLVLRPGESGIWLGPDFAQLADRSTLHLASGPEA